MNQNIAEEKISFDFLVSKLCENGIVFMNKIIMFS